MTTIHTILLVPAEGDPLGLLAEGVFWARVSIMWYGLTSGWRSWTDGNGYREPRPGDALVLAHNGKPVPEGCERVDWAIWDMGSDSSKGWLPERTAQRLIGLTIQGSLPARDLLFTITRFGQIDGPGTLIFLDADGREVTP